MPPSFDYRVEAPHKTTGLSRHPPLLIGDRINEDKTILVCEEFSTRPIKRHYAEKDGILACLLPAQKTAARCGPLPEESAALHACLAGVEVARRGMRLPPDRVSPLETRAVEERREIEDGKI